MSVAVFDTHAFAERLTAVGMPEAQAKVIAAATKLALAETKVEIYKWIFGIFLGFQTLIVIGAIFAMVKTIHP